MSNRDQELYLDLAYGVAKQVTEAYSTSFSQAIRLYKPVRRQYIYAIYGMVRVADEIVDAGFTIDSAGQLKQFEQEVYTAIETGYSNNLVLHAFQDTVNRYHIPKHLIEAFFVSMAMDLQDRVYTQETYEQYIYGSAEVVGLMCLCVFCEGDMKQYAKLEQSAKQLGAGFQKVNFLRDLQADVEDRKRQYFPGFDRASFSEEDKKRLVAEIAADFQGARAGVGDLPRDVERAVLVAVRYFEALLTVIERTPARELLERRVRVPNWQKFLISLSVLISRG